MSSTEFMLAKEYSHNMKTPRGLINYNPPIRWLMSEKLDGYRAIYNPNKNEFESRQNKLYTSPKWFRQYLPEIYLDGELFCDDGPLVMDGLSEGKLWLKKISINDVQVRVWAWGI